MTKVVAIPAPRARVRPRAAAAVTVSVRVSTANAATVFIQITSCEPASADQTARKPPRRSGASAESLAAGASGWEGALRVMGSEDAANVCIMLDDGRAHRETRRQGHAPRRRPAGRGAPGHGLPRAQRGDALARQPGDGPAGAARSRGGRLSAQPDRARAQDEPLLHGRRAYSRSHQSALPADP